MFRLLVLCLVPGFVLLPAPSLWGAEDVPAAETEEAASGAAVPFFPLLPLVRTVREGEVSWTPSWPAEIPPDAFTLRAGRAAAIALVTGAGEYRLRRNSRGLLEEFPFLLEGALVQVRARLGPSGEIRGFTLASDPVMTVEFDVPPEFFPGEISRARLVWGEQNFSIIGQWGGGTYTETWYDGEGSVCGFFTTALDPLPSGAFRILGRTGAFDGGESLERYGYDAFGNVSFEEGPGGLFSAIYAARRRPRYQECRPLLPPSPEGEEGGPQAGEILRYSFQWDEQGLLVRLTGGGEEAIDCRYEYTQDSRGNWTERREQRMVRRFGVLVAGEASVIRRTIEYGGQGR